MSEMFIVKVITKHDSPPLPYLSINRMLQSVYGWDNKSKINYRQNQSPKGFLLNRCSQISCKIYQKAPEPEPLLNKSIGF